MVADPACPPPPALDLASRIESQKGHIRQLVSRSGLPPDQWEDAYQDVALELVRADARFDPDRGRYSTFAGSVCKNVLRRTAGNFRGSGAELLRMSYRPVRGRCRSSDEIAWEHIPSRDASPLDILIQREEAELKEKAESLAAATARAVRATLFADKLAALSPSLRGLAELSVLDGLTVDQIAEQTGQPVKIVRRNLQRVVEILSGRTPKEAKAERLRVIREAVAAEPAVSDEAVADRIGVSPNHVRELRRKLGLPAAPTPGREPKPPKAPRPPKAPKPPRVADEPAFVERLRALIQADRLATERALAAALGVSETKVRRAAHRTGLDALRAAPAERKAVALAAHNERQRLARASA